MGHTHTYIHIHTLTLDPSQRLQNKHKIETFISPAGFDSEIPAVERSQTYVLDRKDTGIGRKMYYRKIFALVSYKYTGWCKGYLALDV